MAADALAARSVAVRAQEAIALADAYAVASARPTTAPPMAWTVHLARALTLCAGEARRQRTTIEVARRGMLGRVRRSEKRVARAKAATAHDAWALARRVASR